MIPTEAIVILAVIGLVVILVVGVSSGESNAIKAVGVMLIFLAIGISLNLSLQHPDMTNMRLMINYHWHYLGCLAMGILGATIIYMAEDDGRPWR